MNPALFLLLLNASSASVTPNPATITISAASPTVSFAGAGVIAPNGAVITIAAAAPTVIFNPALAPSAAAITITAASPALSFAAAGSVAPAAAAITVSAASPALAFAPLLAPSAAVVTIAAAQPPLSFVPAAGAIIPSAATITLSAASPAVYFSAIDTHAPVSLAEAKAFLKVETADDDGLIGSMIDASSVLIENVCGVVCQPRTHQFIFETFAPHLELLLSPVRGVDAIEYVDSSGADQAVYGWSFRARYGTPTLFPEVSACWPYTTGPVTVTADIGYVSNADIPAIIRLAAQVMISSWYQTREVGEIPAGALAMLQSYRTLIA